MRLYSLQALLAITFWGASFVATKVALQELSPLTVVTVRFALGLLVLWGTVVVRGRAMLITGRELGYLAMLGAIGIFVHQLLQTNGLVTTSATNTGWLVALTPIFAALLARALLGESFGPARVSGLLLAFAGAMAIVVTHAGSVRVLGLPATPGDFLAFLAPQPFSPRRIATAYSGSTGDRISAEVTRAARIEALPITPTTGPPAI